MARGRGWPIVAALLLGWGCSGDAPIVLAVELRTDYLPGEEFDEVRVTVADVADDQGRTVSASEDFLALQRVAEVGLPEPGDYLVTVELRRAGAVVTARSTTVDDVTGSTSVPFSIRRCLRDADCPPDRVCDAYACIEDACAGSACGVECELDADCRPAAEPLCGVARCLDGLCFQQPVTCPGGRVCHPERGCDALLDAGQPDAGPAEPAGWIVTVEDELIDMVADPSGDVIVLGLLYPGSSPPGGAPVGAESPFLARYSVADASLRWVWVPAAPGDATTYDPSSLALSTDGVLWLVTAAGRGFAARPTDGRIDGGMILVRFDASDGRVIAQRVLSPEACEAAAFMGLAPDGGAVLAYRLRRECDFGGGPVTQRGGREIGVLGVDATGAHRWSYSVGTTNDDSPLAGASDGIRFCFAGNFLGRLDGPPGWPIHRSVGRQDVFFACVDPVTGANLALRSFGFAEQRQHIEAVTPVASGFAVSADLEGDVALGGALTATGPTLMMLGPDAEVRWARPVPMRLSSLGGSPGSPVFWSGPRIDGVLDFGAGPVGAAGDVSFALIQFDAASGDALHATTSDATVVPGRALVRSWSSGAVSSGRLPAGGAITFEVGAVTTDVPASWLVAYAPP